MTQARKGYPWGSLRGFAAEAIAPAAESRAGRSPKPKPEAQARGPACRSTGLCSIPPADGLPALDAGGISRGIIPLHVESPMKSVLSRVLMLLSFLASFTLHSPQEARAQGYWSATRGYANYNTELPYKNYALELRWYRSYRGYGDWELQQSCERQPFQVRCYGTQAHCLQQPTANDCLGTEAYCRANIWSAGCERALCERQPNQSVCRGSEGFCLTNPNDRSCEGTRSHCERYPTANECEGTEAFCRTNPTSNFCKGTYPFCQTYPTSNSCKGTEVMCLNSPTSNWCRGTPAHCSTSPSSAYCTYTNPGR